MKRAAMTALLKDDPAAIERYEELHRAVWAEVQADNERCGLLRVFIYRFGRRLFMFLEGDDSFDISTFGDRMTEGGHPRTLEWLSITADLMEPAADGQPGLEWTVLPEICALEATSVTNALSSESRGRASR